MSDRHALDQEGFDLAPLLEHDPKAAATKLGSELPHMSAADTLTVAGMANIGINNAKNTFVVGIPAYHSCHVKSANLYIESFSGAANEQRSFIKVGNLNFKTDACTAANFSGMHIETIPSIDDKMVGQSNEIAPISDADFAALEKNIANGDQWSDDSVRTLKTIVQNIINRGGTIEDIHRWLTSERKELNSDSGSNRLGWVETKEPDSEHYYVYAVLKVSQQTVERDITALQQGIETPTAKLVGTFPPPESI